MSFRRLLVATTGALVLTAPLFPAAADAVEDFYKGKIVTITLGTAPGATFGIYAMMLSEHLGKYIPGAPKVIVNARPGGGGMVAAGYVDNAAPRDGTMLSQPVPAIVIQPLFQSVKFDPRNWSWIGAQTTLPSVISVWHTAPATTLDGAKKTELVMGSNGRGSDTYTAPQLANALLGTRFKVVTSYKGGADINLAMERGEVHGRKVVWSGWTAEKPDWLRDKKIIHLLQYGPAIKDIPEVPRFRDLVTSAEDRQAVDLLSLPTEIGSAYYVHREVPGERTEALRAAFARVQQDPAYIKAVTDRKFTIEYVPGEKLQKLTAEAFASPPALIERMKKVFN